MKALEAQSDIKPHATLLHKILTKGPVILFVGFYAGMTLIGVGEKILQTPHLVESFKPLGIVEYSRIMGVFDLLFAILYFIPKTRRFGFILSSCYLAGAMGAHVSHHMSPWQPVSLMVIFWIGAFLWDRTLFIKPSIESVRKS